jgi:HK97 family phage prohead protease
MPFAEGTTIDEWVARWTSLPEEDVPTEDLQGKPFPNEHAARIKSPGQYKRFRRENDAFGSGIDAIWGIRRDNNRVELQAIRFDKNRFNVAQARKWLKDHDYVAIMFEPASGTGGASDGGVEDGAPEDPKADKRVEEVDAMTDPEKKLEVEAPKPDEKPKEDLETPVDGEPKPDVEKPNETAQKPDEKKEPIAPAAPVAPEKPEPKVADPIQKAATYHSFLADAQIIAGKADDGLGDGWVEGYASEFNKIDHQDEVVRKGAFVKTIAEKGDRKIPLMAKHFANGGDIVDCVGAITWMSEDDYGLKFRAEYLPDEKSQEVRKKVEALRAKNVRVGTSIGYRRVQWGYKDEDGRRILEHTEIALVEVTMTLKPANEGAFVTGGKDEKFVAAIKAVVDSKTEALDKSRLLEEFGGRDDVAGLADRLEKFVGKLRDLLTDKPQDADAEAGSTVSEDAASTPSKVDLHLAMAKVKDRQRKLRMLELCTEPRAEG